MQIRALERPTRRFEPDILGNMAASVMQDHGNDVYSSLDMSEVSREASARPDGLSSSAQSSSSDQDQEDPKPVVKRKRKSHNTQERGSSYRNLSFDPEIIIHPRSTEWLPCEEVAQYIQDHIHKGFDREVRKSRAFDRVWIFQFRCSWNLWNNDMAVVYRRDAVQF
ncbi:hypothetical protein NDU88_002793 [Pleurodeles waltl]|uniref:Uncharacterized protein n=1 Tax=Pleurodeles waltl TaxID=8319 RepID=A0AAV7KUS1_PLEWA|nr:hypothetical protein NDU88_002793 [Pleurodeles waltl]